MDAPPRICVVIPVFNHGRTLRDVVRGAKAALPVIVVNDGSTDDTPIILAGEPGVRVVTLPVNQGKGAALQAGFARACELSFTHAITLDADGQHPVASLTDFAAACRRRPEALIVGVRDLSQARAPFARRFANALSNLWFRLETSVPLGDTQCGYRCYPLAALDRLRIQSGGYGYELEALVKAAWAGIPLETQAVTVDYDAPTSRLSHFHPLRDFGRLWWLHLRLTTQALCFPSTRRDRPPPAKPRAPRGVHSNSG